MSNPVDTLAFSSAIHNNNQGVSASIAGQGLGNGTWTPVLKQAKTVHISNLHFNDNNGVGGVFSMAVVRRGFVANQGACPCDEGECIIPKRPKKSKPCCVDLTNEENFPQTRDIVIFEAAVCPNEFIAQDSSNGISYHLEPCDELWINADTSVNYTITYS